MFWGIRGLRRLIWMEIWWKQSRNAVKKHRTVGDNGHDWLCYHDSTEWKKTKIQFHQKRFLPAREIVSTPAETSFWRNRCRELGGVDGRLIRIFGYEKLSRVVIFPISKDQNTISSKTVPSGRRKCLTLPGNKFLKESLQWARRSWCHTVFHLADTKIAQILGFSVSKMLDV